MPPSEPAVREPSRLVFDDVVVDFAACRVLRGGVEQPLEPKAFAVLALLAASPGTVHARDAILDAVWGHRHVTPGVLNRVMTLLRQALGEDAQHPRYLHTVHGVGYRFDLAEALPAPGPEPAIEAASAGEEPILSAPRRRAADRRRWPIALAGAAVLALVIGGIAWWQGREPAPPGVAPKVASIGAIAPTLMVAPLKAIGEDSAAAVIAEGLSEELIGSLAQIDGLRVIARETTLLAVAESADPVRWAAQAGITHALEGSLQLDGQHLRVRLRLVEAGSGRAAWARDFDRDAKEVLALQREIAESVATSLALRMRLQAETGEGGDAEFLRRFHAARALVARRDLSIEQGVEPAETELRALLRERPDDARVHATLARALELRAAYRPTLTTALRREAQELASIALRLDPSSGEGKQTLARAACRTSDWARCITLLEEAKRSSSDPSAGRFALSITWARLGYLDRAEAEAREAVAVDPLNTLMHFLLGRVLDTRGRHEEAQRSFAKDTELSGVYGRWFNAANRGDHQETLRIAEVDMAAGRGRDSGVAGLQPSYVAVSQALIDPARWPEARRAMADWERGSVGRMAFLRVLDSEADPAALVDGLVNARRVAYSSWDLLLWSPSLAHLRHEPAFQRYVREDGLLAYWRAEGFPPQCREQGEVILCD